MPRLRYFETALALLSCTYTFAADFDICNTHSTVVQSSSFTLAHYQHALDNALHKCYCVIWQNNRQEFSVWPLFYNICDTRQPYYYCDEYQYNIYNDKWQSSTVKLHYISNYGWKPAQAVTAPIHYLQVSDISERRHKSAIITITISNHLEDVSLYCDNGFEENPISELQHIIATSATASASLRNIDTYDDPSPAVDTGTAIAVTVLFSIAIAAVLVICLKRSNNGTRDAMRSTLSISTVDVSEPTRYVTADEMDRYNVHGTIAMVDGIERDDIHATIAMVGPRPTSKHEYLTVLPDEQISNQTFGSTREVTVQENNAQYQLEYQNMPDSSSDTQSSNADDYLFEDFSQFYRPETVTSGNQTNHMTSENATNHIEDTRNKQCSAHDNHIYFTENCDM